MQCLTLPNFMSANQMNTTIESSFIFIILYNNIKITFVFYFKKKVKFKKCLM